MSEFDISDKEIKSLLQSEGLDEPSMGFNQSILSKIKTLDKANAKPVTAPKWLLVLVAFLFVAPSLYFIFSGQASISEGTQLSFKTPSLNPGIGSKYILICAFSIVLIGISLLLERMIKQQSPDRSR